MTDQFSSFSYLPLEGGDAVRLLIVDNGKQGSEIYCRLIHTALSECYDDIFKHYTALSYVREDVSQKRAISVNSQILHVMHSLFDALHDLRPEEQALRLWADAICIDQLYLDERSTQVGLME
ncbi:uncharacterized protein RSE6_07379 [Rhynchosporium secalis]|uniref:Heterokaryon incompatibility domain-containing protein n=1 Tax=Rhynchosporium secalis TaxID=38038 RepID=A0A1E1MCV5_RHYSE|nr:uncharacterized protein RSE6_07379 [Rhynchosporium secalis]